MTSLPPPIQSAISALFGDGSEFTDQATREAAATLAGIARQAADHEIKAAEAADLVEAQREATFVALQTIEGAREIDNAVAFDALKALIVKAAGSVI